MTGHILCIAGPTASGKSDRAVAEATTRGGEIISVDSRQVYRGLDIGTEKITREEMRSVPHHLIDIRDPQDAYSAGDFIRDAERLIREITARGKVPILAGGTHFYFDALLYGLPNAVDVNPAVRAALETLTTEELFARVCAADPRRANALDPHNRRRLIRALEIIEAKGAVPARSNRPLYTVDWVLIDPPREELRKRIDQRLTRALERGLIDEVRRTREIVSDERLNELGLEYRIVGQYLRKERSEESLFPALSARILHYARHQKAWLRKLTSLTS